MDSILGAIIEDGGYDELGFNYTVDHVYSDLCEIRFIEWAFAVDGGVERDQEIYTGKSG
jgi:hypothetical protein